MLTYILLRCCLSPLSGQVVRLVLSSPGENTRDRGPGRSRADPGQAPGRSQNHWAFQVLTMCPFLHLAGLKLVLILPALIEMARPGALSNFHVERGWMAKPAPHAPGNTAAAEVGLSLPTRREVKEAVT